MFELVSGWVAGGCLHAVSQVPLISVYRTIADACMGRLCPVAASGRLAAWFFLAEVPLYAVTGTARIEVMQASYPVQAAIHGKIVEVSVTLGQQVQAGTVLVRLEDTLLQRQRKEAQVRYDALPAQLAVLTQEIADEETLLEEQHRMTAISLREAQARYEAQKVAVVFAETEAKRTATLAMRGGLSQMA